MPTYSILRQCKGWLDFQTIDEATESTQNRAGWRTRVHDAIGSSGQASTLMGAGHDDVENSKTIGVNHCFKPTDETHEHQK